MIDNTNLFATSESVDKPFGTAPSFSSTLGGSTSLSDSSSAFACIFRPEKSQIRHRMSPQTMQQTLKIIRDLQHITSLPWSGIRATRKRRSNMEGIVHFLIVNFEISIVLVASISWKWSNYCQLFLLALPFDDYIAQVLRRDCRSHETELLRAKLFGLAFLLPAWIIGRFVLEDWYVAANHWCCFVSLTWRILRLLSGPTRRL